MDSHYNSDRRRGDGEGKGRKPPLGTFRSSGRQQNATRRDIPPSFGRSDTGGANFEPMPSEDEDDELASTVEQTGRQEQPRSSTRHDMQNELQEKLQGRRETFKPQQRRGEYPAMARGHADHRNLTLQGMHEHVQEEPKDGHEFVRSRHRPGGEYAAGQTENPRNSTHRSPPDHLDPWRHQAKADERCHLPVHPPAPVASSEPPTPVAYSGAIADSESRLTYNPQEKGYSARCLDDPDSKRNVETNEALKIKVRFNVIQITQVDQVAETFNAYFVMHFFWVDPLLQQREITIKYKALDSSGHSGHFKGVQERTGFLVGIPGYKSKTKYEFIFSPESHVEGEGGIKHIAAEKARQWYWLEKVNKWKDCYFLELPPGRLLFQEQPDWEKERLFRPEWSFRNLVADMFVPVEQKRLLCVEQLGGCVHQKFAILGQFSESLELHRLPFDRQLLRIEFASEQHMENVQYSLLPGAEPTKKGAAAGNLEVPLDGRGGSGTNTNQLPSQQSQQALWMTPREWRVFEPCRSYCLAACLDSQKLEETKKLNFSTLQRLDVVIHLERNPRFYLLNVVLFMFLLTWASCIAFLVDVHDVSTRTSILLTLLLCTVGYKNIVSDKLPSKPYWSYLDWYILAAFLVQMLSLLEIYFVLTLFCGSVDDDQERRFKYRAPPDYECSQEWPLDLVDKWFGRIVYGIWCVVHVIFYFCFRCRPSWFLPSRDKIYKFAPKYAEQGCGVGSPHPFGFERVQ